MVWTGRPYTYTDTLPNVVTDYIDGGRYIYTYRAKYLRHQKMIYNLSKGTCRSN